MLSHTSTELAERALAVNWESVSDGTDCCQQSLLGSGLSTQHYWCQPPPRLNLHFSFSPLLLNQCRLQGSSAALSGPCSQHHKPWHPPLFLTKVQCSRR